MSLLILSPCRCTVVIAAMAVSVTLAMSVSASVSASVLASALSTQLQPQCTMAAFTPFQPVRTRRTGGGGGSGFCTCPASSPPPLTLPMSPRLAMRTNDSDQDTSYGTDATATATATTPSANANANANANAEDASSPSGGSGRKRGWADRFGNAALNRVEALASSVNRAGRNAQYNLRNEDEYDYYDDDNDGSYRDDDDDDSRDDLFSRNSYRVVNGDRRVSATRLDTRSSSSSMSSKASMSPKTFLASNTATGIKPTDGMDDFYIQCEVDEYNGNVQCTGKTGSIMQGITPISDLDAYSSPSYASSSSSSSSSSYSSPSLSPSPSFGTKRKKKKKKKKKKKTTTLQEEKQVLESSGARRKKTNNPFDRTATTTITTTNNIDLGVTRLSARNNKAAAVAAATAAAARAATLTRMEDANDMHTNQGGMRNAKQVPPPTSSFTTKQRKLQKKKQKQQSVVDGNQKIVLSALASLERDMQVLDNLAASRPQLSPLEVTLLTSSVLAAAGGPIFFPDAHRLAEVLAPAAAAFSAAIGIGAEYVGRVAVADGKEIAASTIQCAAEAEAFLANAERVKAVLPLCVGVGACAAPFSLLAPVLIDTLVQSTNWQVATELYLFCPLVAVLSAATAALALQETRAYSSRAISVGNRRFAKSGLVGRTWLSSTEQVQRSSQRTTDRWKSFVASVIPAPILGALVPSTLPTKAIVVTAIAAAQSAYYLAQAENTLARATDAVALKARSAAVADTYANQGARSAAILPFTSALSALCAAVTAALVELPWLESLAAMGGPASTASQVVLISFFPMLSALFASAASVSKARCEVDAEAASQAASTLALEYEPSAGDGNDDPVLRPFRGVIDLIWLTANSGWKSFKKRRLVQRVFLPVILALKRFRDRIGGAGNEMA